MWIRIGIVALIALVVLLIILEGARQQRRLRARGEHLDPKKRASVIGVGLTELQGMLEPDRKVEVIQMNLKDRERLNPAYRASVAGDPPETEDGGDHDKKANDRGQEDS